jgi:hypothetical protein
MARKRLARSRKKSVARQRRLYLRSTRPEPRDVRADVVWGVKMGSKVAIAGCLLALAGLSLAAPGPFETVGGFNFFGIAAIYLVAGPLLGGVVGWLRPFAESRRGRMLIGLGCGALFGVMIVMATDGLPWTTDHTMMALIGGVGAAIGASRMRRPRRR